MIKTEYISLPASLTMPCSRPDFLGETFGELVLYTSDLQSAFDICNSRITGIIDWQRQYTF